MSDTETTTIACVCRERGIAQLFDEICHDRAYERGRFDTEKAEDAFMIKALHGGVAVE